MDGDETGEMEMISTEERSQQRCMAWQAKKKAKRHKGKKGQRTKVRGGREGREWAVQNEGEVVCMLWQVRCVAKGKEGKGRQRAKGKEVQAVAGQEGKPSPIPNRSTKTKSWGKELYV